VSAPPRAPLQVLYAQFSALPGREPELERLVREYGDKVRAEPGNLTFRANLRRDNRSSFFVYEEYADVDAFNAHVASAHGSAFNAILSELIVGEASELTFLLPL
jgi:quinol monooxygenase YgiN